MFRTLPREPGITVVGFGLTWSGRRQLATELADQERKGWLPIPAAALLRLWERSDVPPIEWWTGSVDVVHGTNYVVPPSRRAARLVTVHDLSPVRFPELCAPTARRYPDLLRRAIASGASVLTASRTVADEVTDHFRISTERVFVVRNGLTAPAPVEERPYVDEPYILGLGTVEPRKNFPVLVAAFDAIANHLPDVQLKIAGLEGWGEAALHEAIRQSPHRARIHRIGWIPDRLPLIKQASVFVYPSVYEGFGFPPLEAMSLGVPVVASTGGALPEILGSAALLVPPHDVRQLAEAMEEVLTMPATRERLVRDGKIRSEQFKWEDFSRGVASVYRHLAGAGRFVPDPG